MLLTNHDDKALALTSYYHGILGTTDSVDWRFNVSDFYPQTAPDLSDLISPFSEAEALNAIKRMNVNSAPGPDGFGPAWYAACWPVVKDDIMQFLNAFHSSAIELDKINRAHIVLLPKCEGATAPKDFRPVSLQNCPVKVVNKILTSRLQIHIQKLVDIDQTGFIRGRSISENFVYATELVQYCHRNKLPTVVLKLDFAKAFDSVNWDSLMHIMAARGFPEKWNHWMHLLFQSSRSAVLVNGCPGTWIRCKRGLR